jgi:uncharacterized protein YggE
MAAALGMKLGRVLMAEEGPSQPPVRPMMARAAAMAAAPTPVEPGLIEVRATVTLTIALE